MATSPLPTDAILKMSLRFLHLWSIEQKGVLSDFEKMVYLAELKARMS